MREAKVLKALIASPNDTAEHRNAIRDELYRWNSARSEGAGVVLLPSMWETDSVPQIEWRDAQSILNRQLVDSADICFCVFYSRLGTPTPRAISGTVEELMQLAKAGKPVHVYFSVQKLPNDVDVAQVTALRQFKAELDSLGLTASFRSVNDLRDQVRRALERDVGG
jgi:hypothetical protein